VRGNLRRCSKLSYSQPPSLSVGDTICVVKGVGIPARECPTRSNLSLIFRTLLGSGTPRELRNRRSALIFVLLWLLGRSSASARRTTLFFLGVTAQTASESSRSPI